MRNLGCLGLDYSLLSETAILEASRTGGDTKLESVILPPRSLLAPLGLDPIQPEQPAASAL